MIKPIQILPFKDAEKKQLAQNADNATKVYDIRFNLSAQPEPKWLEIFQSVWYQQYGGSAIPRFSGSAVQVNSTIEHLQRMLNALKHTASTTNERFQAIVDQKNREEAEEKRRREESKRAAEQTMKDALDKLDFS